MNLIEYMHRDCDLLRKRVKDVESAYFNRNPRDTLRQASEMFQAFSNRFALEDYILRKCTVPEKLKPSLNRIMVTREHIRDELDEILMMHVSEPDFLKGIQILGKACDEFMHTLDEEFHPTFQEAMPETDVKNVSHAVEDRLHIVSFAN